MRFLFALNDISVQKDANINVVLKISREMIAHGAEICFLSQNPTGSEKRLRLELGTDCRCFPVHLFSRDTYQKKFLTPLAMGGIRVAAKLAFRHPLYALRYLTNRLTGLLGEDVAYARAIRKAANACRPDAVISASYPIYTSQGLAKAKLNGIRKIAYFMDSHAYNVNSNPAHSIEEEIFIHRNVDVSIVTPPMFAQYPGTPLEPFIPKMISMQLPIVEKFPQSDASPIEIDSEFIHCVYTGGFYENSNIRRPDYLFALFASLADKHIKLHIIGNVSDSLREKYKMQTNICFHGGMSHIDAQACIAHCDIAVNLGNSIANQLTSKILEYIASGRPIVNIYKIPDCPTLACFQAYPMVLNIKEGEPLETAKEAVLAFCLENRGKRLDEGKIIDDYRAFTPAYFVRTVLSYMEREIK